MKVVGLTGNIGSGKSTVAGIFEALEVPVFKADEAGKWLLENDDSLIEKTLKLFPEARTGRAIDRRKLAEIVFADETALKALNALVHPAVGTHFQKWLTKHVGTEYVIREAAILFEAGANRDCDKVICVTCPEDIRIKRVIARDGVSEAKVRARMKHQWPEKKKAMLSDYIVVNDDKSTLITQVMQIHGDLLSG
ncbi:MAG: dephospho-CoA kinase [Salibacteraceae bacterium]